MALPPLGAGNAKADAASGALLTGIRGTVGAAGLLTRWSALGKKENARFTQGPSRPGLRNETG